MASHRNKIFQNQTVKLGGSSFEGCMFDNCVLTYDGRDKPPSIEGCRFKSPRFEFDGPAANTLQFLQAISEPHSGMSEVVRASFPKIFGQ